jgi:uncharacterized protein (TIGR02246 family)
MVKLGVKMTSQGQAIADRWDQAFNGRNQAELGELYSPDGKVIPAGGTAVSGPEKIQAFFTDLQAKGFNGHKITVQDVISRGDTLVLTGRWELNGPGEGGETQTYGGNWVNVLERQGDSWRTLLHTWN